MSELKLHKGTFENEDVFYRVCEPQHFFRKFNGFAVSKDLLDHLIKENPTITKVVIEYRGKEKTIHFVSELKTWFDKGKDYYRWNDVQLVLSKEFMVEK